jgi:molybdopterin molybdotransferase
MLSASSAVDHTVELLSWDMLADTLTLLMEPVVGLERISLQGANGRVSAEPMVALQPIPAFTHAVMDGYALGSSPPGHYTLKDRSNATLAPGEATIIAAGETVPSGTVGIVLSDRAHVSGEGISGAHLFVAHALRKDNLRRVGEEALIGDVITLENTQLDARHIALATVAGIDTIAVKKRPRIALIGIQGTRGSLPHLTVMAALITSSSLKLTQAGTVQTALLPALLSRLAPDHDLIIVVAESLGGEGGVLSEAVAGSGGTATVHRAALKPAKPVITGKIGKATLIGLSGTAYATTIAAHLFVRPLLLKLLDRALDIPIQSAVAHFERTREPGRAEALPVMVQRNEQEPHLVLTSAGRFGQLKALAAMDGFAIVEADTHDVTSGMPLSYMPLLMPLV